MTYAALYTYTATLRVMDFNSTKNTGPYRCSILIGSEYVDSTEWYKHAETFLNIRNESARFNLIGVKSFGGEIEFKVTYEGNPIPTVFWIDNHGEVISSTEMENENTKFVISKDKASLKIRNLNFDDPGIFSFHAENTYRSKVLTFRLSVDGKVKYFFTFTAHGQCR